MQRLEVSGAVRRQTVKDQRLVQIIHKIQFEPRSKHTPSLNRSMFFYVSTTFILTNNNWTICFDCYSVILRSFSKVISQRELCAHVFTLKHKQKDLRMTE